MTIQEIKTELGVTEMVFRESKDEKSGSIWHKHFNNDKRLSVSVPDDVFQKMLADREIDVLSLKYDGEKVAKSSGELYKKYYIVVYKDTSGTF